MIGRYCGLACKHADAIFVTKITFLATSFEGCASHWSSTSFRRTLWGVDVDDDANGDDRNEIKSLGCFPITIFNVITPKL